MSHVIWLVIVGLWTLNDILCSGNAWEVFPMQTLVISGTTIFSVNPTHKKEGKKTKNKTQPPFTKNCMFVRLKIFHCSVYLAFIKSTFCFHISLNATCLDLNILMYCIHCPLLHCYYYHQWLDTFLDSLEWKLFEPWMCIKGALQNQIKPSSNHGRILTLFRHSHS